MSDIEYNVSWEKYSEAVVTNFGRLVEDDVFTDVTLVSNDERYIKAHKAVLSLNSPFFKSILTRHPHSHPLIFLDSLTYEDLRNLINFIYLGETKVIHEDLNNFLTIGQKFKLQGMMDFKVKQETLKIESKEDSGNVEVEMDEPKLINSNKDISKEIEESEKIEEVEYKPAYEQRKSMASIPTETYQCSQCDYSASYAGTLKYHRRSKHDKLKYPCKNCNYSATSLGSLSRHKRNVHDGEKYPCDSCSFKASSKDSLKMHIKSQHEGVRFPCTTCEYEATQQAKLKQHVRKNHTLSG